MSYLVRIIEALGGSIDITVNFPEKEPMKFSHLETLLFSPSEVNNEEIVDIKT